MFLKFMDGSAVWYISRGLYFYGSLVRTFQSTTVLGYKNSRVLKSVPQFQNFREISLSTVFLRNAREILFGRCKCICPSKGPARLNGGNLQIIR